DLELAIRDARLLLEALGPVVGPFVEGLVELAAHVEHDGRGELLGGGAAGHGHEGERQDGSDESPRVGHGRHLRCAAMIPEVPCQAWPVSAMLWPRSWAASRESTLQGLWDFPRPGATSTP